MANEKNPRPPQVVEHWGTLPSGERVEFRREASSQWSESERMVITIGTTIVFEGNYVAERFADSVRGALRTVFQR